MGKLAAAWTELRPYVIHEFRRIYHHPAYKPLSEQDLANYSGKRKAWDDLNPHTLNDNNDAQDQAALAEALFWQEEGKLAIETTPTRKYYEEMVHSVQGQTSCQAVINRLSLIREVVSFDVEDLIFALRHKKTKD